MRVQGGIRVAGKKGRSGPPGNMNAARHGWSVYLKRRALPKSAQWAAIEALKYRDGLLRERPDPTEAERRTIELAVEAKVVRLLIWRAIREQGLTRQGEDGLRLVPAAEALPRFIGVELGALKMLGLERRPKDIGDLAAIIQEDMHRAEQPGPPTQEEDSHE